MTVSLFVRSEVKDFGIWKENFDGGAEFVKQKGVIASGVLRDLDNPNLVIVHHEFSEISAAKAFVALINSEEFQEGPVKVGGVIPETVEIWVGKDLS
jgi:hypothetical protein